MSVLLCGPAYCLPNGPDQPVRQDDAGGGSTDAPVTEVPRQPGQPYTARQITDNFIHGDGNIFASLGNADVGTGQGPHMQAAVMHILNGDNVPLDVKVRLAGQLNRLLSEANSNPDFQENAETWEAVIQRMPQSVVDEMRRRAEAPGPGDTPQQPAADGGQTPPGGQAGAVPTPSQNADPAALADQRRRSAEDRAGAKPPTAQETAKKEAQENARGTLGSTTEKLGLGPDAQAKASGPRASALDFGRFFDNLTKQRREADDGMEAGEKRAAESSILPEDARTASIGWAGRGSRYTPDQLRLIGARGMRMPGLDFGEGRAEAPAAPEKSRALGPGGTAFFTGAAALSAVRDTAEKSQLLISPDRRPAAAAAPAAAAPRLDPSVLAAVASPTASQKEKLAALNALGDPKTATRASISAAASVLTSNPDPRLREAAVAALARAGLASPEALKSLVAALGDKDAAVRFHAARALGQLGDASPFVRKALIDSLSGSQGESAARALSRLGPASVPDLARAAAESKNPEVRRLAVWALGQSAREKRGFSTEAFVKALGDPERSVRDEALRALSIAAYTLKDAPAKERDALRPAVGPLAEALKAERNAQERAAIARTLSHISGDGAEVAAWLQRSDTGRPPTAAERSALERSGLGDEAPRFDAAAWLTSYVKLSPDEKNKAFERAFFPGGLVDADKLYSALTVIRSQDGPFPGTQSPEIQRLANAFAGLAHDSRELRGPVPERGSVAHADHLLRQYEFLSSVASGSRMTDPFTSNRGRMEVFDRYQNYFKAAENRWFAATFALAREGRTGAEASVFEGLAQAHAQVAGLHPVVAVSPDGKLASSGLIAQAYWNLAHRSEAEQAYPVDAKTKAAAAAAGQAARRDFERLFDARHGPESDSPLDQADRRVRDIGDITRGINKEFAYFSDAASRAMPGLGFIHGGALHGAFRGEPETVAFQKNMAGHLDQVRRYRKSLAELGVPEQSLAPIDEALRAAQERSGKRFTEHWDQVTKDAYKISATAIALPITLYIAAPMAAGSFTWQAAGGQALTMAGVGKTALAGAAMNSGMDLNRQILEMTIDGKEGGLDGTSLANSAGMGALLGPAAGRWKAVGQAMAVYGVPQTIDQAVEHYDKGKWGAFAADAVDLGGDAFFSAAMRAVAGRKAPGGSLIEAIAALDIDPASLRGLDPAAQRRIVLDAFSVKAAAAPDGAAQLETARDMLTSSIDAAREPSLSKPLSADTGWRGMLSRGYERLTSAFSSEPGKLKSPEALQNRLTAADEIALQTLRHDDALRAELFARTELTPALLDAMLKSWEASPSKILTDAEALKSLRERGGLAQNGDDGVGFDPNTVRDAPAYSLAHLAAHERLHAALASKGLAGEISAWEIQAVLRRHMTDKLANAADGAGLRPDFAPVDAGAPYQPRPFELSVKEFDAAWAKGDGSHLQLLQRAYPNLAADPMDAARLNAAELGWQNALLAGYKQGMSADALAGAVPGGRDGAPALHLRRLISEGSLTDPALDPKTFLNGLKRRIQETSDGLAQARAALLKANAPQKKTSN